MPRPTRRTTRTSRKPTKRRRPSRRLRGNWFVRNARFLLWAVTIFTIGAMGYACGVLIWPELTIQKIEVEGAYRLSESEVRKAAQVTTGQHMFAFSARDISRTLARVPQIESARVTRRMPNAVRIRIVERVPHFILAKSDGSWLVDSSGVRFERVGDKNSTTTEGLPTVFLNSSIREKKAVQAALLCFDIGREFNPYVVSEIGFSSDGSMVVVLDSGLRIEMGTPELVYQKLRKAGDILEANSDLYEQGEYVNVASLGDPVFRLRAKTGKQRAPVDGSLQGG